MRISTPLTVLGVLAMSTLAQWNIPPKFSFNETAPFSWNVKPGVNLISISVKEELNPRKAGINLPLGPCQVVNIEKQTCAQYANNGTATFGGLYAQGCAPGISYFIYIVWITEDESKNGTTSSPNFMMNYPDDPAPPKGASQPPSVTTATVKSTATSTKTVHLSLISNITTSSFTNIPRSTLLAAFTVSTLTTSTKSTLTTKLGPVPLKTGSKAAIAIGSLLGLAFLIIAFILLYRRHRKQPNEAPPSSDFTRTKEDPSMTHSDLALNEQVFQSGTARSTGELAGDSHAKAVDLMTAYPQNGYTGPSAPVVDEKNHAYVPSDGNDVAALPHHSCVGEMGGAANRRQSTYELDGGQETTYQAYSPREVKESSFPARERQGDGQKEFVVQG